MTLTSPGQGAAPRDMPSSSCDAPAPRRDEALLALLGLLILSDAFDASLYAAAGLGATFVGLPIARLLLFVVFAIAALLLSRDWRGAVAAVAAAWPLWPVLALAFASAAWSETPATTLLWATALLGTSAFGVALALRCSPASQSTLVAAATGLIALAGVLVAVLWPAVGIDGRGQWRGLYVEKNLQGRVMALGIVAAAVAALRAQRRAAAVAALLLCGAVVAATASRAAILVALGALAAVLLLWTARRWPQHAPVILASGGAAAILVVGLLVATRPGLAVLKRDATLSQRTTLWWTVGAAVSEAPWLGHGYGAFWTSASGRQVHERLGYGLNQAHNGAIDVLAELGVVGLALVLAPLAVFGVAALRHGLEPGEPACIWPAAYLFFFVASNVGESAFLRHKVYWALYVAAACHLARQRRPHTGS